MIPAARIRAIKRRVQVVTPQRINKSGAFSGSNGAEQTVTSWTSDGTNPGTIVSDQLSIQGPGDATPLFASIAYTTTIGVSGTARLYLGATLIGSVTMTANATYTIGPVVLPTADGDLLRLTFIKGGSFGSVNAANTYLSAG